MGNTLAGGVQIVRVLMPPLREGDPHVRVLWVAAVGRDEAVAAVKKVIPADCEAELTSEHLPPEEIARLKLRPGDVRELSSAGS
jgi:hypothetical protein